MRGALWMALLLMAGACSSSEHDDAALQPVLIEPPAEEQELPTESLQGMWTEILPISVARNGVGIASDDDALFLVGGFDNLSGTTTAIRFALDGSGESLLPELPEPVAGASVFVRDGALYVMGGLPALQPSGASVPHESCSWLELATGVWSACAAMGNGATSHAAEAWPSDARPSAFLFGGLRSIDLSSGSLPTKVVQRYDFEVDAWVAETALPEAEDPPKVWDSPRVSKVADADKRSARRRLDVDV